LNENSDLKVKIKGYTDNVGSPAFNASLSYRRAQSVAKYIMAAGIPEDRVSYRGFGLLNPRAPNKTEFGRSENRRVEFEVYNN
jgi:OOP family OmpA-OmpF porin